ncbi:protease inhibitor I42 family protein [Kineococcus indalonis]|uniref:protease inhibitor I42 family protein n=1 Tax=Kineococcus indalonis TaxID=2696566 RepID=UPI0014128A63|nr:protease inhibitor I42 family protein [Kineococcus indalonis]NAZ86919.1 hypothetical protein [Kineococcus indalonis]
MNHVESSGASDVEAERGDVITIRLAQDAGTGYVWSLTGLGEGLVLEREQTLAPSRSAPGARGEHLVRLRADRVGRWPVQLRLARAWEGSGAEERTVSITVR